MHPHPDHAWSSTLALPHLRPGRKATWFELFFDLAFVTAVAQLTAALSHHFDGIGLAQFVPALLLLWWTWLGHTFHATRFDEDRWDQHLLGMLQIAAVIVIAYGAGAAFGERGWAFAAGMAALKLLLMAAYLQERRRAAAGPLALTYAGLYAVQAGLWALSLAFDGASRWALWGLVLALDVASPFLVSRHTQAYPPHPEHLPERFGLFTIIVMGEGVASALHALLHAGRLDLRSATFAALGLALAFLYWVGYFERVRGQRERHVGDAGDARALRRWAYAHIPLLAGVCIGAAGLVAATGPALSAVAPWIVGAGIALAMLGLTGIGTARAGNGPGPARHWRHAAIAALPLLAGASASTLAVFGVGVAAAIAQVVVAARDRD
jgi:low temperature requirement protein LtrA